MAEVGISRHFLQVRRLQKAASPLRRGLCTITARLSGHSRWSKIKHDKGKADANKSKERSILSAELTRVARDHGGDPNSNPRLATLIASAKKSGFAKDSIENAIARGSGKSKDGKAFESLSIEVMVPPSVGAIIECQTDNTARTMQDVRTVIKESEGGAVLTPTKHMFERKGRIVVTRPPSLDKEAFFDTSVDAGAEEVHMEGGEISILYTEPQLMSGVLEALKNSEHGLQVEAANVVWRPVENTLAEVPSDNVLPKLLEQLRELPDVQEIFLNVR